MTDDFCSVKGRVLQSTLFPYTTLFRSRLFLLVLILLLMPTLNFLPVWFALSLLRFRLPSKQAKNRSEERFSRNAETELVCRLPLEKKNKWKPPRSSVVHHEQAPTRCIR